MRKKECQSAGRKAILFVAGNGLKNMVDIWRQSAKFAAFIMKSGTINTVLAFVLAAVVLAGVLFVLQTIFREREFRSLQVQILERNNNLNRAGALLGEAEQYSTNHPDIKPILRPFEAKPTTH